MRHKSKSTLKQMHVELAEANQFVSKLHRHHKPVPGHRFSVGCSSNNTLVGVAIVGRPVARMTDQKMVVEVLRLCTDGQKNSCSFLYGLTARISTLLGYNSIQTFILENEPGTSLIAAGWVEVANRAGGSWDTPTRRRSDTHPLCKKRKFIKKLTPG